MRLNPGMCRKADKPDTVIMPMFSSRSLQRQPDKLSGYSAFSPTIDTFLKEHLFADIFERDVLTYAQRELVTISVIAAIGEANPMLKSHLNISLRVGWSPDQMKEFLTVISPIIGKDKSTAAHATLTEALASSKSSK